MLEIGREHAAVANLNSSFQLETGYSLDLQPNFGRFVATRKHGRERGSVQPNNWSSGRRFDRK